MFCFWHRWKIDRALDERAGPGASTRQHMARCPDCRDHQRAQEKLVALLEQHEPVMTPPPYLHASVMNAIRAAETAHRPRRLVPVWVPVAACAMLAFFLIPENTPQPHSPPLVAAAPQPVMDLPAMELPAVDIAKTLEQVQDTIAKPYTKEIENLQNDLKAVGNYMGGLFDVKIASRD